MTSFLLQIQLLKHYQSLPVLLVALKQTFSKENQLGLKKIQSVNYQHPVNSLKDPDELRHSLPKFFENEPGTSTK